MSCKIGNAISRNAAERLAEAVLKSENMQMFCGIPLTALRKGTLAELNLAGVGIGEAGALVRGRLSFLLCFRAYDGTVTLGGE